MYDNLHDELPALDFLKNCFIFDHGVCFPEEPVAKIKQGSGAS